VPASLTLPYSLDEAKTDPGKIGARFPEFTFCLRANAD